MCVFILYLFTEKNQKTKQLLIKVVTYMLFTQLYMQLIDCSTRNMYYVRYKKIQHTSCIRHNQLHMQMDINILNNSWVIYLFLNFPRQAYVSACVQKQKRNNERKSAEWIDINLFHPRNRPITFNNYTSIRLISFCRDYIKDSPRLQKKKKKDKCARFSLAHFPSLEYTFQSLIHTFSPSPSTLPNALIDPFIPNPNLYQSSVWSTFKVPFIDIDIFTHSSWSFKFLSFVSDLFWYDSLRLLWFYYYITYFFFILSFQFMFNIFTAHIRLQ